jgi:hypothetical protein
MGMVSPKQARRRFSREKELRGDRRQKKGDLAPLLADSSWSGLMDGMELTGNL